MTFLPIVNRELRVTARRGSTYWTRLGAALAALAGATWIYLISFQSPAQEMGMVLFVTLTVLLNVYGLLVGLRTTADCLSEEKREGTLGLLFLTDLKSFDIILGKLAATSVSAFYGMMAMFPMLGISLLFGGVAADEFWRVALATANNMLFSLAVGLFWSSVCHNDQKSMALTLGTILLFAAGLPSLGLLVAARLNSPRIMAPFLVPTPGYTVFAAFDQTRLPGGAANFYWLSGLLVLALTLFFLGMACVVAARSWQDRPGRASGQGWHHGFRQWQLGGPRQRLALRQRLLDLNPMFWLTSREWLKPWSPWLGLALCALAWCWGAIKFKRDWMFEGTFIVTALLLHTILKSWLAGEACRRFAEDRRSGALELLLATPLGVPDILKGQRLSLWRQFAGPTVAVLVADMLMMVVGTRGVHDRSVWFCVWLAGMAMLVMDMVTLTWVGMWMGLCSRHPNRAATAALVRICALPWLGFGLLMTGIAMLEEFAHIRLLGRSVEAEVVVLIWFVISTLNNLVFGGWAKVHLLDQFRVVATQRFEGRPLGAWGRILGEWFVKARTRS